MDFYTILNLIHGRWIAVDWLLGQTCRRFRTTRPRKMRRVLRNFESWQILGLIEENIISGRFIDIILKRKDEDPFEAWRTAVKHHLIACDILFDVMLKYYHINAYKSSGRFHMFMCKIPVKEKIIPMEFARPDRVSLFMLRDYLTLYKSASQEHLMTAVTFLKKALPEMHHGYIFYAIEREYHDNIRTNLINA